MDPLVRNEGTILHALTRELSSALSRKMEGQAVTVEFMEGSGYMKSYICHGNAGRNGPV
jgi:hypothetical protein